MATSYELKQEVETLLDQERGTIYKEAPHRVALVYPSPYRVGMSSLGFQTIYRVLNERDDVVCERSFLPDDPDRYRQSNTPLFTFESETPVGDCDVIAFSLSYELELIGIMTCLELASLPVRAADRGDNWPLVIIGGPITFSNPLPAGPFADVIVMGEGEELIHLLIDWWKDYSDREQYLKDVAMLPGVYVPSIHGETFRTVAQARDTCLPAYSPIITPNTELSSMHLVENGRGCHRGCSFCVMRRTTNAGMRPVAPERVLATVPDYARRVGLVGAATSDHPQILDILHALVSSGREVGLSSLRADRLNSEFVGLLARGGARTLTVASDGSSQRMRNFAKKGIKEKHLLRCAELVRETNMKLLKLYMVIGYPGETLEDMDEMIAFLLELSKICKVALGMSPLVAKKNTPLDGVGFEEHKSLEQKIKHVHKKLGRKVDIRATSVRWAWIESEISQGGFDMADAAEAAYRQGASYSAWKRAIRDHKKGLTPLRKPESERLMPGALLPDEFARA
ncbi:radical SAM protein [Lujinxingia litoralis]|uniref:Radical SAM protein n=1 Tax=Lujinxingia litoralis TaxID=2211119 RepID=A0A328C133_9DELT|nr:radical SAM protein [Lujinxingia litoralis]RAL20286.1 radical SAM protein [Lujinxingia litoralis]